MEDNVQDLKRLNRLITRAATACGSDNKLAERLGTTRQTVSNWRHGVKEPGLEKQAQMADIAGIDAGAHLLAAAVEKTGDPRAITLLEQVKAQSILIQRALA